MITITLPEWMGWAITILLILNLANELLRWYADHLRAEIARLEKGEK